MPRVRCNQTQPWPESLGQTVCRSHAAGSFHLSLSQRHFSVTTVRSAVVFAKASCLSPSDESSRNVMRNCFSASDLHGHGPTFSDKAEGEIGFAIAASC